MIQGIDRNRLARLLAEEEQRFAVQHPRSQALFARARGSLLAGVPMPWMVRWAGAFPVFVAEGQAPTLPTSTDWRISTSAWATPAP